MKTELQHLISAALETLRADGTLTVESLPVPTVERARDRAHGDFASNVAMVLAKPARCKPRELAERIVAALPSSSLVLKADIAGPGFINFFIDPAAQFAVIDTVLEQGKDYGRKNAPAGGGAKVQVEFISANPTGPLHVGHGRHAAYGASLAALLDAAGYAVQTEYYVNDAGRQMDILAVSVWLRYLERRGSALTFPSNGYKGDYLYAIADAFGERVGDTFMNADGLGDGLPADKTDKTDKTDNGGDAEAHIDALIARAKERLGDRYAELFDFSQNAMLDDIRADLEEFGVHFDRWYSERGLVDSGAVDEALKKMQSAGVVYEQDGALWFNCKDYGDDKDRVVRRANGSTTYFASDVAYIADKFARGFDKLIYVWGADHHGTVPRLMAACTAQGFDTDRVDVPLIQFVNLFRGDEKMKMSTRGGEFVTLRELRAEVGNDAARFFYVDRKNSQHLDFDLDLAKARTNENPVFYVQYMHARICSVFSKLPENNYQYAPKDADYGRLDSPQEQALIVLLARYPEAIAIAARNYDPQVLTQYLRELANAFHSAYNVDELKVLVDDAVLRNARLSLYRAAGQVVRNGLNLIGVSAPEAM